MDPEKVRQRPDLQAALAEWESDSGGPASASEGNAFLDGFSRGVAFAQSAAPQAEREAQPLPIAALREWLKAMADAEYSSYIGQMKHPAALGWEAKCKAGEFGDKELTAHTMAGTYLGHHQALMRVLRKLNQLEPLPAVPQPTGKLEFNAEFHNPEKAWLLIFDGDKDRFLRVSREDVTDLLGRLGWLKMKFEAAESGSQPAQAETTKEKL